MHFYVNPYVAIERIGNVTLNPGDVLHVFTDTDVHQIKRTAEKCPLGEVVRVMGWKIPAKQNETGLSDAQQFS
jgi:hypothetical protein